MNDDSGRLGLVGFLLLLKVQKSSLGRTVTFIFTHPPLINLRRVVAALVFFTLQTICQYCVLIGGGVSWTHDSRVLGTHQRRRQTYWKPFRASGKTISKEVTVFCWLIIQQITALYYTALMH